MHLGSNAKLIIEDTLDTLDRIDVGITFYNCK